MWMTILGFLGGPVMKALVDSYKAKLVATSGDKITAAKLAGEEIGAQVSEGNNIYALRMAQIGHPWEPEKLAFYVWLVYFAKCVVWDTVLGLGVTGPIKGNIDVWCNMLVVFYFGKRAVENVATIIKGVVRG